MPRLTRKLPSYRLHKRSGQAVVTLNGRDIYLGRHGTAESKTEYDRLIAEWLTQQRSATPIDSNLSCDTEAASSFTVDELLLAYWDFAVGYYVKDGRPTGEQANIKDALRPLAALYGPTTACDFGPRRLETVRAAMVQQGLSRKVVNARVNRVRRMFKWATSRELIPPTVLHALQSLQPLKRGRSDARETEPVSPIANDLVEAVLPLVSSQVAAMIRLQLLTGMRPGEVVIMRSGDIDTTGRVWRYTPSSHKTEHHEKGRVVYLGPRAQKELKPWLRPDLNAFLFSPAEAERDRRAADSALRITPLSCGNTPGSRRRSHPTKQPATRYTTTSYGRAIANACDAAFPPPIELARRRIPARGRKTRVDRWETAAEWRDRLGETGWDALRLWRRSHRWSPNRLRHNAGTFLRKEFGIEAARVVLGHSSAAVTEVYAELDYEKARGIMAEVG